MMTMLLPIPPPKVTISFFYLPYDISEGYLDLSGKLTLSQNDTLADLRRAMKDKYDVDPAFYTVTKVNNNEFTRFFNHKQKVEALQNETEGRFMMFYEVDRSLKPSMPQTMDKADSNHGIDSNYTRLVLNMCQLVKSPYSDSFSKEATLPRLLWVDKRWTLKELHRYVFKFLRFILAEWIDWKDGASEKPVKKETQVLRTDLIDFPYKADMTKKSFLEMSESDCFDLCFPGLVNGEIEADR